MKHEWVRVCPRQNGKRKTARGWKCVIEGHPNHAHNEPCGLVPRWWNWSRFARRYRRAFR